MPIYKPSELRMYLEGLGMSPKKGLSQNFLLDGNIIHKIVALSELSKGDIVLEIGPGPGALTEALLEAGATVLAVEKDSVLADGLRRLEGNLKVFNADIMDFDFEKELAPHLVNGKKAKVIANLPYHLTTPIITRFIPKHELLSKIVVMVQNEVAKRFTASPGSKEYGSITVFLNFYSHPKYGFKVSSNCFYPKPGVDSAMVGFDLRVPPTVSSEEDFFEMTRTAFGQRRKMLRSTLKELYSSQKVEEALEKIGCSHESRPEMLSLDQFLKLFDFLQK